MQHVGHRKSDAANDLIGRLRNEGSSALRKQYSLGINRPAGERVISVKITQIDD